MNPHRIKLDCESGFDEQHTFEPAFGEKSLSGPTDDDVATTIGRMLTIEP